MIQCNLDHLRDLPLLRTETYRAAKERFRRACRCAGHGGGFDLRRSFDVFLDAVAEYFGSGVGARIEEYAALSYLSEIAENGSPRVPSFSRQEWGRVSKLYRKKWGTVAATNPSVVMTSEVSAR